MAMILVSLFCVFGLTVIFAVGMISRKQAAVYSYDVTQDYAYDFEGTEADVQSLTMSAGRICLPSFEADCGAAFLKVEVKASFLGRYIQPCFTVRSAAASCVQFFERGAKGVRYINVSSLCGRDSVDISLVGQRIGRSGNIDLIRFKNAVLENPTVLVIAPHPDDAEIAAYGFYSEVENTYIVTITAGDAGPRNYDRLFDDDGAHFLKKGEQRTWESITVPMLCGIPPERAVNLGFFDGTLQEMYANKDAIVAGLHTQISDIETFRKQNSSSLADLLDGSSSWNSLVKNLERLLEQIKPDIIITPHPSLDSLDTHRFSTIATLEAVKNVGLKDGRLFMYANHHEYNHLIPYGPAGSAVSLPPSFGETTFYSSLYSHALSPEKQRGKIFSLEAMSDLRLHTNRYISSETTWSALKAPLKGLLGFDESYFRRAIRANELFFVVEFRALYDEERPHFMSPS